MALYIFRPDGYHHGKQWFAKTIRYPEEEILSSKARERVDAAIAAGLEVRICNGGDLLVFHAVNGKIEYPTDVTKFWLDVGA